MEVTEEERDTIADQRLQKVVNEELEWFDCSFCERELEEGECGGAFKTDFRIYVICTKCYDKL